MFQVIFPSDERSEGAVDQTHLLLINVRTVPPVLGSIETPYLTHSCIISLSSVGPSRQWAEL